jgi:hypothetical protein
VSTLIAAQWAVLDDHFREHAKQVDRFKNANATTVRLMWASQTDERGNPLSQFERHALIERYCELFGTWPN